MPRSTTLRERSCWLMGHLWVAVSCLWCWNWTMRNMEPALMCHSLELAKPMPWRSWRLRRRSLPFLKRWRLYLEQPASRLGSVRPWGKLDPPESFALEAACAVGCQSTGRAMNICFALARKLFMLNSPRHISLAAGALDTVPSGKHAHMIITY